TVETFLAKNTLLHDEHADFKGSQPNWAYWARECGVSLPKSAGTRRFGQSNMVIEAAINGLGVALGREPLVIDALLAGRLVRPYPQIAKSPLSYWLVYPHRADEVPKIHEFLRWIHSEVRDQPDIPDQMRSVD
ncbi:MAG: LysR substrate-binding domain-containing protein, partial [Albidovulum sp.]